MKTITKNIALVLFLLISCFLHSQDTITFKNKTGKEVKVSIDKIVESLNKFMIKTIKEDSLTTFPIEDHQQTGKLNWDEVHKKGGLPRKATNIFEMYKVLKEAKMSPGYTFALNDGISGMENQFASSTLKNTDRTKRFAIDGMLYPSGKLPKDVKGEGVSYKEMSMSFKILSKERGDEKLAKDHLKLLQGEELRGYSKHEISKMYYHLYVMLLAEGRRSAGMFVFSPITLQNIADGYITGKEAFGEVKESLYSLPSAYKGSKSHLEQIEKYYSEKEKSISTSCQKLLERMNNQVKKFFSEKRTDFSKEKINKLPHAGFENERTALKAINELIREKFFSTIPAMYKKETDKKVAKRDKNRYHQKQEKFKNKSRKALNNEDIEDFSSTQSAEEFYQGLQEYNNQRNERKREASQSSSEPPLKRRKINNASQSSSESRKTSSSASQSSRRTRPNKRKRNASQSSRRTQSTKRKRSASQSSSESSKTSSSAPENPKKKAKIDKTKERVEEKTKNKSRKRSRRGSASGNQKKKSQN